MARKNMNRLHLGLGIRRTAHKASMFYALLRAHVAYQFFEISSVAHLLKTVRKEAAGNILRRFGASIGDNCEIGSGLIIENATDTFANLIVGDNSHIGKDVFLDLRAPIKIHDRCTVSMRTTIITHVDMGCARPHGDKVTPNSAAVEIGPDAYIGAGTLILAGTRIGEGCIVGAGAVVTKNVPNNTTVAGVPAKPTKDPVLLDA